MYNVINTIY